MDILGLNIGAPSLYSRIRKVFWMNIEKETYRKVLGALEKGPKSSQEIFTECGFPDAFHCSSALSILVRQGLIAKGYRLTEAGQRAVAGPQSQKTNADNVPRGPAPPIPRPPSPGFEWTFDEQKWEWVQRRKPGFEVVRPPREQPAGFDLFG